MSSPWSSDNSIWQSNSPNLNIARRYSLRNNATTTPTMPIALANNNSHHHHHHHNSYSRNSQNASAITAKSTCSWEPSADGKYLIGYIVINRQDLELDNSALGFHIAGDKPTHDGRYGAIVEHVVPGSLMNIICKLKVGDEIVEWNGFNLRDKRNDQVANIMESAKNANCLRIVAVRLQNNNNNKLDATS